MHGKEWKKSGGKEHNGDNESNAEFVMTLDKLEPGQAGVILELNTGGGMRRRLMDLGFSAGAVIFSASDGIAQYEPILTAPEILPSLQST